MANLYLSHWSASEKVYVPQNICSKLKPYHISIIRSLYRCLQKRFDGAVLNYDEGINVPLAFQALWQALINANKVKLPFLTIVSNDDVITWHYYLSQLGNVSILNSTNYKEILERSSFSIILVPICNIKLLQDYQENQFSFVVVEDFDNIAAIRLFKRLRGVFNVALTRKKFTADRNFKMMWNILNWTNPGKFGKLKDFEEFDLRHLNNLRNPYDDVWYTYNCDITESDSDERKREEEELQKMLNDWAKKNNLPKPNSTKTVIRKRRANSSKSTKTKRSKKNQLENGETYDVRYHEQARQIVSDGEEKSSDIKGGSKEEKKLRDITDLNYSQLINGEIEVIPKKKNNQQSPFKSSFSKNGSVKRKSFEFMEKRHESTNESILPNIPKQNPIFPSLEDILSLKKKIIHPPPLIKPVIDINDKVHSNNNINKQSEVQNIEGISMLSLEEVFKCKRKLTDSPRLVNKSSIVESAPIISPINRNNSDSPDSINKVQHSIEKSNKNGTKRIRICNQHKIFYRNVPECISTSNKETQTNNLDVPQMNATAAAAKSNENSSGNKTKLHYDGNINKIQNINKNVEGQELIIANTGYTNKVESNNKFTKTNRDLQSSAVSVSRTNPLQNLTNVDANDLIDEEESVLLSIIEGKFSSQTSTNLLNKKDKLNRTTSNNIPQHNSQLLLSSLFGEPTNYNGNEIDDSDGESQDILFKLNHSKRDNTQLKVKTIDQINKESFNQTNQNTCESLKVLFGTEAEYSDYTLGIHKTGKHNLISSLFG